MLQKSYVDNYKNKGTKNIHKHDPKTQPITGVFLQFYYFIIGAGAVPVRLLIRDNIGERSITPLALFTSLGIHIWYVYGVIFQFTGLGVFGFFALGRYIGLTTIPNSFTTLEWVVVGLLFLLNGFHIYIVTPFFIRGRRHFKKVSKRAKNNEFNEEEGSYYRGDIKCFTKRLGTIAKTPIGRFKVDKDNFGILIEPYYSALRGIGVTFISLVIAFFIPILPIPFIFKLCSIFFLSVAGVGILYILSAFCLFLEELGLFLRVRDAALDIIDGEKDLKKILKVRDNLISNSVNTKKLPSRNSKKEDFPIVHTNRNHRKFL